MRSTILQLGTAALTIGGFVVLTLKGADTTAFIGLVTPILGAVFVINHLDHRSDKQDETLGKIQEQTNGVLDKRIKEGVLKALAEREGSGTP